MDAKKELDKTLVMRRALFDYLVKQVKNQVTELCKAHEEHVGARQELEKQVEGKISRIDNLHEQLQELGEVIKAESTVLKK
jgi:phage shock protein A